ncbi:MAG: ROK family protein [Actinomycetaceae bacterium]|nr:ROK family protein [Actinomycetaceae bacterium]
MNAGYVIAVDVGGTSMKLGVASRDGKLFLTRTAPTPKGAAAVVSVITQQVSMLREVVHNDPKNVDIAIDLSPRVGVAVPGVVDEATGMAVLSVNVGWKDVPMLHMLEESLACPVTLGHDVRSGALAEARWGAGLGDCIFIPIGTGVSAGIVLNDRLLSRAGWSGEIGQILQKDPEGDAQLVPMERLASAKAISRRYRELHEKGRQLPGCIETPVPGTLWPGTRELFDRAENGDELAQLVIDQSVHSLSQVIAQVIGILGPLRVVIGGGLSNEGGAYMAALENAIASQLHVAPMPPIVKASLGSWAQCLGIGAQAFDADDAAERLQQ